VATICIWKNDATPSAHCPCDKKTPKTGEKFGLSDGRCGRRGLTELFARRLGGEFGVDYQWLMGGKGPKDAIPLRGPAAGRAEPRASGLLTLPVLPAPLEGEPQDAPLWDGSLVELTGAAAAAAGRARRPYVLRLDADDRDGRLRAGDLILISQESSDKAEIGVIRLQGRLALARRLASAGWRNLTTGRRLTGKVEPVGCRIAIVWASL
jgi:hypothetical protein